MSTPRYVVEDAESGSRYVPVDSVDSTTTMEGFKRGVYDPIEGLAQAAYNVLPVTVQKAGDALNNWIADKTGLVPNIPPGGLNDAIKQGESEYQARRAGGVDLARLGGNIVSPANLMAASKGMAIAKPVESAMARIVTPYAAKLSGSMAGGASGAAAQSAMMPVTEGDYGTEKAKQIATGTAVGAALPWVAKLIPERTEAAQKLIDSGVSVSAGQQLGGMFKRIEDRLQSWPLLGDAIRSTRVKSIEDFNEATWNKVLEPIGLKLPKGIQGRDAVGWVQDRISKSYDRVLPNLGFKLDQQYLNDMATVKSMVQTMPAEKARQYDEIIRYALESRMTNQGNMNGESLKAAESALGGFIRTTGSSQDVWDHTLHGALRETQDILRSALERQNPMYAPALKRINLAQAMEYRPERAATALGASEGVFTPAQLTNAVKAMDKSKNKRAFAKGDSLMQDWAESGKSTLSQVIPDSGTAERVLGGAAGVGGAAGAGSMLSIPLLGQLAGLYGASTVPYLPGGRQFASGLIGLSGDVSKSLAKRPGVSAPLFYPLGYGLLENQQ